MRLMSRLEIHVSIDQQILELREQGSEKLLARWPVSTALKGAGNAEGSNQTPLGRHRVRARIGAGQPIYTVFRGRRPTGEIHSDAIVLNDDLLPSVVERNRDVLCVSVPTVRNDLRHYSRHVAVETEAEVI